MSYRVEVQKHIIEIVADNLYIEVSDVNTDDTIAGVGGDSLEEQGILMDIEDAYHLPNEIPEGKRIREIIDIVVNEMGS